MSFNKSKFWLSVSIEKCADLTIPGLKTCGMRHLSVFLLIFVVTQVVLFGFLIPLNQCAYMSWLAGLCVKMNNSSVYGMNVKMVIREHTAKPKPTCPLIPPNLKGNIHVDTDVLAWADIEDRYSMLQDGGRYHPPNCKARHRVAVIIPFRDRDIHLKIFLNNIHAMLQRQQLDYGIYVVDLARDIPFNRALLLNVGFMEANKVYDYQCYIFHDVDLIPEQDHNMYTCPEHPRHMSVAIDKMNYRLPYSSIFGGVSAMTKEHMETMNGYSNKYFGWGGEDDDMYRRIKQQNMTITRYTSDVARYKMLSHRKDKGNPNRFQLLKGTKARYQIDGLNSLHYKVLKKEYRRLYTYVLVRVNETEIMMIGNKPKVGQ